MCFINMNDTGIFVHENNNENLLIVIVTDSGMLWEFL